MSSAEKTYSDTTDSTIISVTPTDIFDQWNRFEENIFSSLLADKTIQRHTLLNAGAGRRITETEAPFFNSFAKIYLLEPDIERRAALAANTRERGAILLSERIEELDAAVIEAADFVQCKYVLQHIHTDLLRPAVERLKSVVAKSGAIGIFSAASPDDSFFQMEVPADSLYLVPTDLRADANGRITEAQFNRLMSCQQSFPFIATHHIGVQTLLQYFAGWNPVIMTGPSNLSFLLASKPAGGTVRRLLSTARAMIRRK